MAEKENPVLVASPPNCTGTLVQLLPEAEGLTFNSYKCQTCGQLVHVGHEDLAQSGMPPEHSPVLA